MHDPHLPPGVFAIAIDAHGQGWPVVYKTLANSGSGNGVLVCAAEWNAQTLPRLLALGPVHHEPAVGGPDLGYWSFHFQSFRIYHPVIRGTPVPGSGGQRETIELRVPLAALEPEPTLLTDPMTPSGFPMDVDAFQSQVDLTSAADLLPAQRHEALENIRQRRQVLHAEWRQLEAMERGHELALTPLP